MNSICSNVIQGHFLHLLGNNLKKRIKALEPGTKATFWTRIDRCRGDGGAAGGVGRGSVKVEGRISSFVWKAGAPPSLLPNPVLQHCSIRWVQLTGCIAE